LPTIPTRYSPFFGPSVNLAGRARSPTVARSPL
jgi:hypothetical protein